jgi:hypothetical protein
MNNLFEPTAAAEIIARLGKLKPESQAQWGKMNVSQMLAHCQAPFRVYFGDLKLKRVLAGFLFGRIAKKQMFSDKPWRRNLPTAKEFVVVDTRNFDEEKKNLVNLINRFNQSGDPHTTIMHSFFGPMTSKEWAMLVYRHTDYHLQQFGA